MYGTISGYYCNNDNLYIASQAAMMGHPEVTNNRLPDKIVCPNCGSKMRITEDYTEDNRIPNNVDDITSFEGLQNRTFEYSSQNWTTIDGILSDKRLNLPNNYREELKNSEDEQKVESESSSRIISSFRNLF